MNIIGFLFSSERSGSNLLTQMINSHPRICGPAPSHMIRLFAQNLSNYGDLSSDLNWNILLEDVLDYFKYLLGEWKTKPDFKDLMDYEVEERTLKNIIEYAYFKEASFQGKEEVFIKENKAYKFLPYLLTAFPDAKYVYLVRDPRDTVLSFKKSINIPVGIVSGVEIWVEDQKNFIKCMEILKGSGKIMMVKYEDLIRDSKIWLKKICNHLNIEYSPEMLQFQKHTVTKTNSAKWPEWSNLSKPILSNNFEKYKGELEETEIRYIETKCDKLMDFLDYKPTFGLDFNLSVEAINQLQESNDELIEIKNAKKPEMDSDNIRANRLEIIKKVIGRKLY